MQDFTIERYGNIPNGIGGNKKDWKFFKEVQGYLDLIEGTDLNPVQNAFVEESTHILIIPTFTEGITDDMRIVDKDNRFYMITYSDNPVGVSHHNEIYCRYGGVVDE